MAATLVCLLSVVQVNGFNPLASFTTSFHKQHQSTTDQQQENQQQQPLSVTENFAKQCAHGLLVGCLVVPQMAAAVAGGGLDYAQMDVTGQDFSNSNAYKGKDFTQVIAKGTNFANSNLQGCRFYKAYLVNTDFSGADLRGAALDDTSMDGASLKDTIAVGAYFSQSLLEVASLENADFTDASIPPKILPQVCERPDAKGINPVTGVDTAESLMCP